MALSTLTIKARIGRQLAMLGFDSVNADGQTDIMCDAVRAYTRRMDLPVISASLSVTASDDGPYTIPATIRKVQDVRDADGDSVVYTTDTTVGKITLQDAPGADASYTVYGTPKEVRTNLDAVVAAITEDHEGLLMAYCAAYARMYVNEQGAADALMLAERLALKERMAANRTLDQDFVRVKEKDVRGQVVDDASNVEGHDVDVDDSSESDL